MDMVNDGKDPLLDTPQAVKEALLSGKDLYNTETGEFWWLYNATDSIAIECHQLHSTRGMPGNDCITLRSEAQAMKAASAEMADGAGKHDIGLDAR